jgi:hypothetical protein
MPENNKVKITIVLEAEVDADGNYKALSIEESETKRLNEQKQKDSEGFKVIYEDMIKKFAKSGLFKAWVDDFIKEQK